MLCSTSAYLKPFRTTRAVTLKLVNEPLTKGTLVWYDVMNYDDNGYTGVGDFRDRSPVAGIRRFEEITVESRRD
jgi:hypothetical protein